MRRVAKAASRGEPRGLEPQAGSSSHYGSSPPGPEPSQRAYVSASARATSAWTPSRESAAA